MACRNQRRAQEAIEKAKEEIKFKYTISLTPQLEFLGLDMNDMNKTRQAAQEFLKKGFPLHILANNPGIAGGPLELSADGIGSESAVNHMG